MVNYYLIILHIYIIQMIKEYCYLNYMYQLLMEYKNNYMFLQNL